jgi:hypothetical protein
MSLDVGIYTLSELVKSKSNGLLADIKAHGVDNIPDDPKQVAMGIKVEMEHTKSKEAARLIALAHLKEMPDYYTRLKAMEKKGKKDIKKSEVKPFSRVRRGKVEFVRHHERHHPEAKAWAEMLEAKAKGDPQAMERYNSKMKNLASEAAPGKGQFKAGDQITYTVRLGHGVYETDKGELLHDYNPKVDTLPLVRTKSGHVLPAVSS